MKILVVDDDALIRESLKILLDMETDIEVTGTASNGQEAYALCQSRQPDIILMDVRMPVMNGVRGTELIKSCFKDIKIVLMTAFEDDEFLQEAIRKGAEGYLLKNESSDSIIESLRAIHKGDAVFTKGIARSHMSMRDSAEALDEKNKKNSSDNAMTRQEMEILTLVGDGMSNQEISKKLLLSEGIVKNDIGKLLKKFRLRDRTHLTIFYLKNFS